MSYQEIQKISRGRKGIMILLIICGVLMVFLKKVSQAQDMLKVSGGTSKTESGQTCNHKYNVEYTLVEKKGNVRLAKNGAEVNKCEPITVSLGDSTGIPADKTKGGYYASLTLATPLPQSCEDLDGIPTFESCQTVTDQCLGIPSTTCSDVCPVGYSKVYVSQLERDCCFLASACGACACGGACGACACACGGACGACACGGEPMADVLACNSLNECLNQGTWHPLDSPQTGGEDGKGVVKLPTLANLTAVTSAYLDCSGNQCTAYAGGTPTEPLTYTFQEKVNATKYYGQCRNTALGIDIKMEGGLEAITDQFSFKVINRAPRVTSLVPEETKITPDDEAAVTCNVVDDDCQGNSVHREISNVEWNCYDKDNNSTGCYFKKEGDWQEGSLSEDLSLSSGSGANPYQSTVQFKAHDYDNYTIKCQVEDSDKYKKLVGSATTEITVGDEVQATQNCRIINVNDSGDQVDTPRIACVETEQDIATVKHKALVPTENIDIQEYRWQCDKNGTLAINNQAVFSCSYGVRANPYWPQLSVKEKGTGKIIPCNTTVSTLVSCTPKCSVGVKLFKAGEFSPSLTIEKNSTVIGGFIKKQCLTGGTTEWTVSKGGTKDWTALDGDSIKATFGDVLQGEISAEVTRKGINTTCDKAKVETADKIEWRR